MRDLRAPLEHVLGAMGAYAATPIPGARLETLCRTEIGLYLQEKLMPGAPAGEAWVLFSGYPFARARGVVRGPEQERMLRVARYTLWTLRRRRAWHDALEAYQKIERPLRGYDVPDVAGPSGRRDPQAAPTRWAEYDKLLRQAPPPARRPLRRAEPGPHAFPLGRGLAQVDLPPTPVGPPVPHDLALGPAGDGAPLTVTLAELDGTAAGMDARRFARWRERLADITLAVRTEHGFRDDHAFTIDGILHLLGIVGAGKSTLRDILTVHLVGKRGMRVTVVVGDVAEVLKLVELYTTHLDAGPGLRAGHAAAPVLGASGRERHAQRLHRRLAGRGEYRPLAHDDPGFAYLSTSCVLNALRADASDAEPLGYGEAPCTRLLPRARRKKSGTSSSPWGKTRVACPYWAECPRHHAPRELVGASVWVATPAGLLDASPPAAQNGESIRYLELACRRSDLVVVDEADRVQMQFDQMFAPAVPLVGGQDGSFLDDVNEHKIRELSLSGRTQLSDRDVENWSAALNTVGTATDRLFAMLVGDPELRTWVRTGYFSAWTLQAELIGERFPHPGDSGAADPHGAARQEVTDLLDAFRDNPFGDRPPSARHDTARLTSVLAELLHTGSPDRTQERLSRTTGEVFSLTGGFLAERDEAYERAMAAWRAENERRRRRGRKPTPEPESPDDWRKAFVRRFEFTLMLSALEPKLALLNAMWPRVQAALNLGFNSMYRRPDDYGPMVPEAPMGNLLGFQFLVHGPDEGGVRSGELRFFRCRGVGRELLRALPGLPTVDGRPGPHVLLMSGSSWAGRSSRYHVPVEVGLVIRPRSGIDRVAADSVLRVDPLHDGDDFLRVSGAGLDARADTLCAMARVLGASEEADVEGGPFERELLELPPERRRLLLLVGSYDEARDVADTLHTLNGRWKGRVLRLASDDDDADVPGPGDEHRAGVLRRGDVENLSDHAAEILVAPLLAVERGHNILNDAGHAALGTVYFLARPNPRPDDLSLAVHAVNDWIVRAQDSGAFDRWVRDAPSLEEGAIGVRDRARSAWYRVLSRTLAWSRLGDDDRTQVTWDMLVLVWQVIGRLVRGGVPARVVFVDAAFAPGACAVPPQRDDHTSSLLHSMLHVLRPYFTPGSSVPDHDRYIVHALYGPLWTALNRCLDTPLEGED